MVLPGVHPCSPLEEGTLHSWIGGLGAHPFGGEGGGFKKLQGVGSLLSYP